MSKVKRILLTFSVLFAVAVIIVYIFNPFGTATKDPRGRVFGHIPYSIPSRSMEPTLLPGDLILTKTYVYLKENPKRNEVIVFAYPQDPSTPFIMRIVGLRGDSLKMMDGILYVDELPVQERYVIWHENAPDTMRHFDEKTVPDNDFFVMGDNRGNSRDSRFWGFLPKENIIGRAHYIWWAKDNSRTGPIKHGT